MTGPHLLSVSRPIFYLLLLSFYTVTAPTTPLLALYVVTAALFVATSAIEVGWLPVPHRWVVYTMCLELVWSTIVGVIAAVYHPDGPMPALFSPLFVTLFFDLDRPWLMPTLAATTLLWLLTFIPLIPHTSLLGLVISVGLYGAFNLFSAAMGAIMRDTRDAKENSERLLAQVRESQAALERAHRQLQESAARQQEMAVLEERQRLAREIHDSVAHSLTALVVQIQVARRLLDRSPEQSAQGLAQCEETARHALLETRQAVRALHPAGLNQQTEVEALRRLGRDFGAATGMSVTVEASEGALALPPDPNRLEQLYRIFQEALTNAHRHGKARQIAGRLSLADGVLELLIANDGEPPVSLDPGLGLRSMAERAHSLGGAIAFEPGPPGLTIRVTVPVGQEAVR